MGLRLAPRLLDLVRAVVDADDRTAWPDALGKPARHVAAAAADFDDFHPIAEAKPLEHPFGAPGVARVFRGHCGGAWPLKGSCRGAYRFRTGRFRARFDDGDDGAIESRSQDYQRLRRELLDAERNALIELRRSGAISNEVWIRVGRDLDLEDQRLDI
jgi:hypothetical protein